MELDIVNFIILLYGIIDVVLMQKTRKIQPGNDEIWLFQCYNYGRSTYFHIGSISTLYKNTHNKNHEHSNLSNMGCATVIVGAHVSVDNCYWWRENRCYLNHLLITKNTTRKYITYYIFH